MAGHAVAEKKPSRRREIVANGGDIALPPLYEYEGAEDLVAALMQAGPTEPGGMAEVPMSWRTLEAWARLTETHLSPGDFEVLRLLSEEYLGAGDEYRHKQVPPPFDKVEVDRRALAAGVRGALRTARG